VDFVDLIFDAFGIVKWTDIVYEIENWPKLIKWRWQSQFRLKLFAVWTKTTVSISFNKQPRYKSSGL